MTWLKHSGAVDQQFVSVGSLQNELWAPNCFEPTFFFDYNARKFLLVLVVCPSPVPQVNMNIILPQTQNLRKKMMYSVDVSNMILPWSEKYHHTTEIEIKRQSWISLTFHSGKSQGRPTMELFPSHRAWSTQSCRIFS